MAAVWTLDGAGEVYKGHLQIGRLPCTSINLAGYGVLSSNDHNNFTWKSRVLRLFVQCPLSLNLKVN